MSHFKSDRRQFIKSSSLVCAAVLLPSLPAVDSKKIEPGIAYKYPNPGKIVMAQHSGAVLGLNSVDEKIVQSMFDQAIMRFTGITSSPADALASLFPGLTTSKKIAIKPNLYNASVPARKELAKAVITRLVQMLGGFPATNITFFERNNFNSCGYTTAYFDQPVNLVTDTTFPDLGYYIYCNGKNRPYSKSLHDADYFINMPVLKDAGCGNDFNLTLSFKNHMGTINPGGTLGIHCDKKACLDIMADSVMTTKQRLVITDCLFAIYNGGPSGAPQAMPKKIMISQDPVTSDYQARKIINELRAANGLTAKSGSYIEDASKSPYEIGVADPSAMNVISLQLTDVKDEPPSPVDWMLSDNYPNPFSHETQFILELQKSTNVDVSVYDIAGKEIRKLISNHLVAGSHVIGWNASNQQPGVYVLKAMIDGKAITRTMVLMR